MCISKEKLSDGETGMSVPDVDGEQVEGKWKFFRRVMFAQFKSGGTDSNGSALGLGTVLSSLLTNGTLKAAFPSLVCLASLVLVLPVTTATVERSFSDMKLVKTWLRSKLGEETLDQALRVCIEGPNQLCNDRFEAIITHWKEQNIGGYLCNLCMCFFVLSLQQAHIVGASLSEPHTSG